MRRRSWKALPSENATPWVRRVFHWFVIEFRSQDVLHYFRYLHRGDVAEFALRFFESGISNDFGLQLLRRSRKLSRCCL